MGDKSVLPGNNLQAEHAAGTSNRGNNLAKKQTTKSTLAKSTRNVNAISSPTVSYIFVKELLFERYFIYIYIYPVYLGTLTELQIWIYIYTVIRKWNCTQRYLYFD